MANRQDATTRWSPFDPLWYQQAFDKFTSTADELFYQDEIIKAGYRLPDGDGSKSSVFHRDAVLNNSFDEKVLRETLKDIYLNGTHRLKAANHDNVHFYQWHGHMTDMKLVANTNMCEFTIPTETFIRFTGRDRYKIAQYLRKWITLDDLLNHWDIFQWYCLLFIDRQIYSDYEFRIDDRETIIRFPYYDIWVKNNVTIGIYKFDTNGQCRIQTSKFMMEQNQWMVPLSSVTDPHLLHATKVVASIHRNTDSTTRKDGNLHVSPIGNNIEFCMIRDGMIDLSTMSDANKAMILSEPNEYLYLSLFIPKFLHEYPIMLPVDLVYRPYESRMTPLYVIENQSAKQVFTMDDDQNLKQVLIDANDDSMIEDAGWNQMIRPIVLSDSFDHPELDPYEKYATELDHLREMTIKAADLVDEFRFSISFHMDPDEFKQYLDDTMAILTEIHTYHNTFLNNHRMGMNDEYDRLFNRYVELNQEVLEKGPASNWFVSQHGQEANYWTMISPMIHIPRDLADRYEVSSVISAMGHNRILWEDVESYLNQHRFRRPIDTLDFWIFEYNEDKCAWYPVDMKIEHHFPDVYLITDKSGKVPDTGKIFKAFFFYSDTMNVRNQSEPIIRPTPEYDTDMEEFMFDRGAVYRDIFMEKFYWMGIKSIYPGMLYTGNRWEVLEYVINNPSYQRFNELFLQTMDPYFKMGLATYLKHNDYAFPFDYAISKMKESINTEFLGYQRVTNFEMYLDKDWVPSYFDYVVRILDDWDWSNYLVHRPRSTMDMNRIIPVLQNVQVNLANDTEKLNEKLDWIRSMLAQNDYHLNIDQFDKLKEAAADLDSNMQRSLDLINALDLNTDGVSKINEIIAAIRNHSALVAGMHSIFDSVYQDATDHNIHAKKKEILDQLYFEVQQRIAAHVEIIIDFIQNFDMDQFMLGVNDLRSYFTYNKENDGDRSLIGLINDFDDPWGLAVKDARNELFVSTLKLSHGFQEDKSYSTEEILAYIELIDKVNSDIDQLRKSIVSFCENKDLDVNISIMDRLDFAEESMKGLQANLNTYNNGRNAMLEVVEKIRDLINQLRVFDLNPPEYDYSVAINSDLTNIVHALSYITGQNNADLATTASAHATETVSQWISFVNTEKSVFDAIFDVSMSPNWFIDSVNTNQGILEAICDYLETVNIEFIPLEENPSYSDVYEITEVELMSGGFNHKVNDTIFIPNLGVYQITEIDPDNVSTATAISKNGAYRSTQFNNPVANKNPYDSITNGSGLGVAVKAIASSHMILRNDEVVLQYGELIASIAGILQRNITWINPFKNSEVESAIDQINDIKSRWDNMLKVYADYMYPSGRSAGDLIVNGMVDMIPKFQEFIEVRQKIDLEQLLISISEFMSLVKSKYQDTDGVDSNFNYYLNRINKAYNSAAEFYGTGTSWNSSEVLVQLLNLIGYETELFHRKILIEKPINGAEYLIEQYQKLNNLMDQISEALGDIDGYSTKINPLLDDMIQRTTNLPSVIQKDTWYRVSAPNIAEAGIGYKAGDIIRIIPQLPTDNLGNPIHDMEDVIMSDSILYQVIRVDGNGAVLEANCLMNYAVPYLIWGVRNTETLVGSGTGLVLDAYSYKISLDDLTKVKDENSYESKTPQFDENDMFAFRFENIYDLPITYEVFLAGKQLKDVIVRHIPSTDPKHPSGIDVVYLKANDVIALQDSVIHVDPQHYFIYKIDDLSIVNPGTGYSVGQDIYVDAGELCLKLRVAKVDDTPYHGIAEIDMDQSIIAYSEGNPSNEYGTVVTDSLNNIDDEYNNGYYDRLTKDGIEKAATLSLLKEEYPFTAKRLDQVDHGNRNSTYSYPDVEMPDSANDAANGDPDEHWYQGSRIDNSATGDVDPHRWNGIENVVPVTDKLISDNQRVPGNQPIRSDFQLIDRRWFHTSKYGNIATNGGDHEVRTHADLPKNTIDWPAAQVGKTVIVQSDETNDGHRMMYRLKTFIANGNFVWDIPILADKSVNSFSVDFMKTDSYPDLPTMKAQYANADWDGAKTFTDVEHQIAEGKVTPLFNITKNQGTYIQGLRIQDLSVFNMTKHTWENLEDANLWKLDVWNDDEQKKWGFKLTYLGDEDYSYDMMLYLNKTASVQTRNANLKSNAILSIHASISAEVNTPEIDSSVNTGRHLRIRKLFSYEQSTPFTLQGSNRTMNVKLANYMHYKNEIHLEDIKLYNKTAGRFENILDPMMFEVRFKRDDAVQKGTETQTIMASSYIGNAGSGFMPGECWCYNAEFDTHVFGYVTTAPLSGNILTFTPIHAVHAPTEDIALEFALYQSGTKNDSEMAKVMIEFQTLTTEVNGDGWIHNVTNRMAPVPNEFQIICNYDLPDTVEYDVIISKTPKTWTFIEPTWMMSPTFHIDGQQIPQDRLYITNDKGRFPLINPGTGKASMRVHEMLNGTDVTFLNLYRKYEELQIHSTPYPMRSVYVQRRVPSHGFIDLTGKLNKPLNKKYFEFWMNGRLLYDEVTIITPTKLFLHGLTSLRNFEIIEVNRDANEYFSDDFIGVHQDDFRPYPSWNYDTYLDGALTGTLDGDNYTEEEQENLLSPVWKQVAQDHPEFKNYPPNTDTEEDILNRVEEDDYPLEDLDMPSYQYMIIDTPTLEGIPIADRNMTFEQFGFIPLTNDDLVNIMNEIWGDEISSGEVPSHNAISDAEWYGLSIRMYDEYGILVHNLNDAAYKVVDNSLLKINTSNKSSRIVRRQITYDLD